MTPSPPTRSRGRRIVRAIILTILALLALLLLVIVIAAAFPIRVENPLASSPVAGYADALAQIALEHRNGRVGDGERRDAELLGVSEAVSLPIGTDGDDASGEIRVA